MRVIASNALSVVQSTLQVDAQVLDMAVVGRRWVRAVNAVDTTILGTSASSTYQVQYRTNIASGVWYVADPDGVSIVGQNVSTPWTDMGGPGRNVTTNAQMFYRAVLLTP